MAKSALKGLKKKKPRVTPMIKRGGKMADYDWTGWEEWSGAKYHDQRRRAINYYYQNNKLTDMQQYLYLWMKENNYLAADIAAIKILPASQINLNLCILAKCLLTGMPAENLAWNEYWNSLAGTMGTPQNVKELIKDRIEKVIDIGRMHVKDKKKLDVKKSNTHIPTIQERIKEQSEIAAEEINDWLDGFVTARTLFDPHGFDFKVHFEKTKVSQAHARKIKAFFEPELAELREVAQLPTPAKLRAIKDEHKLDQIMQLKEGYAHLKKAEVTLYIKALENTVNALDMIIEMSKATRKSPVRKPRSADKIVAKVKYKVKDDKYQVVSINPIDIVGANELWVFNTKTRKIGKYVALTQDPKGLKRDGTGLSVKGTTITGFKEAESIQRTLRKPVDQLKEFKDAGKVKLRTFFDTIKTTETKMNGRLNADTILLKVT